MKTKCLIHHMNPPCAKCPYKLGLVHTVANPCPQCKENGYQTFERFQQQALGDYPTSGEEHKYSVFARSLMDVNNRVLRTVKGRTHFISGAYYCCLAVEHGVTQEEINRTLAEFFSGHPSTSPEYNHTVSAGSAKPASVQTRRDVMWSLLPATDEVEDTAFGEINPDNLGDSEQFEEEDHEP